MRVRCGASRTPRHDQRLVRVQPEQSFRRRLQGVQCADLQCLECWHGETLVAACTVLFLRTQSGAWIRFFFDAGSFFWSDVDRPDEESHDGDHHYRLRRPPRALTLGGATVDRVVFEGEDGEPQRELALEFSSGAGLALADGTRGNSLLITSACA